MGKGGEGRGRGRGGERKGTGAPPHDLFARRPWVMCVCIENKIG